MIHPSPARAFPCVSLRLLAPIAALAILFAFSPPARAVSSTIVISQVYGGGGNSGAALKNDFIEIHNPGATAVSLMGMSVQYTGATGTSWQVTALPDMMLAPGAFALIEEAAGTGGTVDLPAPDATGAITMAGTSGKVALVAGTAAITGACPLASVIDLVGYGVGASNPCSEGGHAAPGLTNTTAALRGPAGTGCGDTNDNMADFASGAPNPRNSGAAAVACP